MTEHWVDRSYPPPVVGVDEVNFSPSAVGDCVVCALWLPMERVTAGLKESKQLTPRQRVELFAELSKTALWCVVPAPVPLINRGGIYAARNWAMETAIIGLARQMVAQGLPQPATALVDGRAGLFQPGGDLDLLEPRGNYRSRVIGLKYGDDRSANVAAASVVAKVYVDALFEGWGSFWPGYGMEKDHGSLSKAHKQALREKGPTPVHRAGGVYGRRWWQRLAVKERHGSK